MAFQMLKSALEGTHQHQHQHHQQQQQHSHSLIRNNLGLNLNLNRNLSNQHSNGVVLLKCAYSTLSLSLFIYLPCIHFQYICHSCSTAQVLQVTTVTNYNINEDIRTNLSIFLYIYIYILSIIYKVQTVCASLEAFGNNLYSSFIRLCPQYIDFIQLSAFDCITRDMRV